MTEHVGADGFYVAGRHVAAALQQRPRLCGEREIDRRARARAELDQRAEIAQLVLLWVARREDDVDDVVAHFFIHMDAVHDLARGEDVVELDHALHVEIRPRERHRVEDAPLLLERRVAHEHLQHEAVHLRLGQRVGAFLIDRIFRREHEERDGQLVRFAAERDLPFLHRFEQRALHFRGRPVDLIREDDVCKNGTLRDVILTVAGVVDERAGDVRGQQVGCELHAVKRRVNGRSERAHRERLREAGYAFEQHVAVREQADEQAIDQVLLADDNLPDDLAQTCDPCRSAGDAGVQFIEGFAHSWKNRGRGRTAESAHSASRESGHRFSRV